MAEKLTPVLGQPVLVENKPGAGAVIGTELVVKSAPDGYTLLMAASGPIVFNPALVAKLSYNPMTDLTPISLVGSFPMILAVNEASPAKTFTELVNLTKANPSKFNIATGNTASFAYSEMLRKVVGPEVISVPYKSSPEAITDIFVDLAMATDPRNGSVISA